MEVGTTAGEGWRGARGERAVAYEGGDNPID